MGLILLETAATRLGVSCETIDAWVKQGLLSVQQIETLSNTRTVSVLVKQLVDEDELMEVAESISWLQLSAKDWDG